MTAEHWLILIHPTLAILFVLPLVGIVAHFAWQTRQRRLKAIAKEKTTIPATVGVEHVRLGRWLTSAVVGLVLIGLAHPILKYGLTTDLWKTNPFQGIFVGLMYGTTFASLVFLHRAKPAQWRGIFAGLTSLGLIILGAQEGVFRRENEWFISHFFYGLTAAILMIVSLAILPEIYKSKTWRKVHVFLNIIAFLLFIGLGITGARDLFEIALYLPPPS